MKLTPRRIEVLATVHNLRLRNGCGPTLRTLGEKLGISYVTVYGHICELRKAGYLEGEGRAMQLSPKGRVVLPDPPIEAKVFRELMDFIGAGRVRCHYCGHAIYEAWNRGGKSVSVNLDGRIHECPKQ